MARAPTESSSGRLIRCAIYTRKSTEEGLDQAFNSLDAQREACAAYILSQRHEGWTLVPEHYDDGGYSGGTMERPGLKQLMADVAANKVDVIIVYKVDRLTRALSDFAKIVDILDEAGASFVSITQAFNTTTSMGRLTLNVLLSFAQFEREVISERVRDKVAASKKKGMWMGGPVALGYDVVDRKLVINAAEAATVQSIMQRYLDLGSVPALVDALAADGMTTKRQLRKKGAPRGGGPFSRGMLYHLLANRIYRGEVVHKGNVYPGEHEAIIPEDLWNAVQARLATNTAARRSRSNAREPSLLTGMIEDDAGRRMKPCHATKGGLRYRYYASAEDALLPPAQRGMPVRRIAAGDIEPVIIAGLKQLLENPADLSAQLGIGDAMTAFASAVLSLRHDIENASPSVLHDLLRAIGLRIIVQDSGIKAACDAACLAARLGMTLSKEPDRLPPKLSLPIAGPVHRRAQGMRLVVENGQATDPIRRDGQLVTLLLKAQHARRHLIDGGDPSDYSVKHLSRMARLAFLAPDIIAAILDGGQPAQLTARQLLRASEIPLAWSDQRRLFGFG